MNRKIGVFVVLFLFLLAPLVVDAQSSPDDESVTVPSDAIETELTRLPIPDTNKLLFGQDHRYSVHFRGNGEAVVTARYIFTNTTDTDLNSFVLVGDDLDLNNLIAYQINRQRECIRYLAIPNGGCAEYGFPAYDYFWGAKYQEAKVDYDGEKLAVSLPTTIAPDSQGVVFLYFRTFDFTDRELFGGYEYEFESLESKEPIQNITVGINVDSDVYLKNAKSGVDYVFPETAELAVATDLKAVQSGQLDNLVNNIGYGQITKTAANLAANESFEVTGEYANSYLALYDSETGVVIIVLVFLALIVFLIAKKLSGKDKKANQFLLSVTLSFASSLVLTMLTVGVYLLGNRGYYPFYDFGVLLIFVYIFIFLFYISIFFAPVIYMGIKHGVGWGLITLFLNIVFLAVMSFASILVFFRGVPRLYANPRALELQKSGAELQVTDSESEVVAE